MRHLIINILLCTCASLPTIAQPIGTWKMYLDYANTTSVVMADDLVFCGTGRQMFSLNSETNEINTFTRVDGLSDYDIRRLAYDSVNKTLIIVYNNSIVDIYKNNKIKQLSDIQRADIGGDVVINDVYVHNNLAYFSTNIGVIVLDIAKVEIKDTYIIGPNGTRINTTQVAADDNFIWAATELGLFYAPITADLWNFGAWTMVSELPSNTPCQYVLSIAGKVWAVVDNVLYAGEENGENWLPVAGESGHTFSFARAGNGKALFGYLQDGGGGGNSKLLSIDSQMNIQTLSYPAMYMIHDVVMQGNNVFWVADEWKGLHKLTIGTDGQVQGEAFLPAGPKFNNMANLAIRGSDLWVAPMQLDGPHNGKGYMLETMRYFEGQWYSWNLDNIDILTSPRDICRVAIHPTRDVVYWGSWGGGLIVQDFKNNVFKEYQASNSTLQADPASGLLEVTGLAFDQQQNLWISNQYAPRQLSVLTPDSSWYSFKHNLPLTNNIFSKLVVDDCGQKWIINHRDGLVVFNHGADFANTTDDQFAHYAKGDGQNSLPSSDIFALAKDRDGDIWVGTAEGIAVFHFPCSVFSSSDSRPTRPYIEINGQGAYLLQGVSVKSIAVDAANRKWVGTQGGGLWLFSPDGTKTLRHFTMANSPLISDNILDIAIDNNTGEVYLNNEYGLLSFKSDALGADDVHGQITVYPNPVRPEYDGDIAIKGLAQDAYVKITDVAGNLVYETRALGSQAIWNGRDYTGRKAATGVYLVLSTNEQGNDAAATKIMVIR